jgi:multiple sugar transport system substrate-binding protein
MKRTILILAAVTLIFTVVSCTRSGGGTSASSSTVGGELDIWTMFTGADGTTFTEMVEAYNATNPKFRFNHQPLEANDLYLKLQLAVSSGTGIPDVAVNHIERIALFQEEGRVTDLTPYLANSPIKQERYNPKAWAMTNLAGGHYGVPLDVHSYILYVNWDLYTKYGLTDLDDGVLTWDELRQTAPKVMADGIVPIGLGWHRVIFLASYAQLGGTLSDNGADPSFNNDIAKRVVNHYNALVNDGLTQKPGEDSWRMFLGGEVLYMPEGIWMYNDILRTPGLNTKSFDFPVFDRNVKGNWTSSHQFTIPTRRNLDTERLNASLEFINWVGENSNAWAEAGQVPAHEGGQRGSLRNLPQAFLANENDELKIYGYKYYGYAVESLDRVLTDIFFGNISADEGLRRANQETRDRIEAGG